MRKFWRWWWWLHDSVKVPNATDVRTAKTPFNSLSQWPAQTLAGYGSLRPHPWEDPTAPTYPCAVLQKSSKLPKEIYHLPSQPLIDRLMISLSWGIYWKHQNKTEKLTIVNLSPVLLRCRCFCYNQDDFSQRPESHSFQVSSPRRTGPPTDPQCLGEGRSLAEKCQLVNTAGLMAFLLSSPPISVL